MRRTLVVAVALVAASAFACQPSRPPDAATTGANCAALPLYTGPQGITADGTVIDGQRIEGGLDIAADNVTVRDSCVEGNGFAVVTVRPGADRTVLARVTIRRQHSPSRDGTCPYPVADDDTACRGDMGVYAMAGAGPLGLAAVDISDVVQGVNMAADDVTVVGSWIHDLALTNPGDHIDGVISNGGSHRLKIQGSSIDVAFDQTTPVALFEDGYRCGKGPVGPQCPDDDIVVDGNWLNGGGFCAYLPLISTNVRVTNNHYGDAHYPSCGRYGFDHDAFPTGGGNVFAGNTAADGSEVTP